MYVYAIVLQIKGPCEHNGQRDVLRELAPPLEIRIPFQLAKVDVCINVLKDELAV